MDNIPGDPHIEFQLNIEVTRGAIPESVRKEMLVAAIRGANEVLESYWKRDLKKYVFPEEDKEVASQ